MAANTAQLAKRMFVKVLLALATAYAMTLGINRDASDQSLRAAFRKLARRVHPDKGGSTEDAKNLHTARDAWEAAMKDSAKPGRPAGNKKKDKAADDTRGSQQEAGTTDLGAGCTDVADPEELRRKERSEYRIQSQGVMLTYNGIKDHAQWGRFVIWAKRNLPKWAVQHWCATFERGDAGGNLHIHLYVQFRTKGERTARSFAFEGIQPRADSNDYMGEGINRNRAQDSMNRGFFYVWADKIGTERDAAGAPCVEGNYMPCWTGHKFKYPVRGRWIDSLWKAHKLSHDTYERYVYLARDGVMARIRNLTAVRENEKQQRQQQQIEERVLRIRNNAALFQPFPRVPVAVEWLKTFKADALRYAILVVLGASRSGKTEWAMQISRRS